jgi:hypothetical protein
MLPKVSGRKPCQDAFEVNGVKLSSDPEKDSMGVRELSSCSQGLDELKLLK